MPYYRCLYHVVWSTKFREPCIDALREQIIFSAIDKKCLAMQCSLLKINGVADHVHLALEVPPSLAVAKVIGELKGSSSREVNHHIASDSRFTWQEGYGVFTFGERALPDILDYITKQKDHHRDGTVSPYLEKSD